MINQNKWVSSLPKTNIGAGEIIAQLDHDKWINTISKKKETYNSAKKYSLMAILFVCGLLFVSVLKNETRNLQKEINNLRASISVIEFNLDQATLDYEVITSPENISLLAKEYLNIDLVSYKKDQIKDLNYENEKIATVNKIKKEKVNKKNIKVLSDNIKTQVAKKVEEKKTEIKKLQELYNNPKSIPDEIKTQVAITIKEKQIELKNIYNEPRDIFTLERVGRWSVVQVVKIFLGMPVIPGR